MSEHIGEVFSENWDCRKLGLGFRVVWGVKCATCGIVAVSLSEEEAKKCMTAHANEMQEDAAGEGYSAGQESSM
jgi:hypothetical protein